VPTWPALAKHLEGFFARVGACEVLRPQTTV
jgi:hypothetical protein